MSQPNIDRTALFLQDACYQHRFIRHRDLSAIVERPERLRALKIGFAAAISRLEESSSKSYKSLASTFNDAQPADARDELATAMEKLDILQDITVDVIDIINSSRSVDILNNKAVKYVHGDIDGDVYLENLVKWSKESDAKIRQDGSEIPPHLSQGDLYLCPESLNAIQGALGTVCEAVDTIVASSAPFRAEQLDDRKPSTSPTNAFVAIRPPGHHCGEDTPSGFCFVNNVIVAAAHAHLTHNIKKVVIFDIDLHHGNGTQSLAWQINEETYRLKLEADAGAPEAISGLQIFYGSLHDILSFPCEDGNASMVQAASVSIHGSHGQHVENIHLQEYQSEEDFWENLYPTQYSKLFKKAEDFLKGTDSNDALVFISCGFDACEHEYPSMSRHNRRVPTSFYHRFAVDAKRFASSFASGKLISVLEGGYSDRALISGGMAHLLGLVDTESHGVKVDEQWWKVANLVLLEKLLKKRRGGRVSQPGAGDKWLERSQAIFQSIETALTPSPSRVQAALPASSRTLRERKPHSATVSPGSSPKAHRRNKAKAPQPGKSQASNRAGLPSEESVEEVWKKLEGLDLDRKVMTSGEEAGLPENAIKKIPRVVLRLKDPDEP